MQQPINVFWFRQDLRLSDNPGLTAACKNHTLFPIYIIETAPDTPKESASDVWLHYSLMELHTALGGNLHIYQGDALSILSELTSTHHVAGVYWNRGYNAHRIATDTKIKDYLKNKKITCATYNASLLFEPWEILNTQEQYYRVFTPYFKKCLLFLSHIRSPLPQAPIALHPSSKTCSSPLHPMAEKPWAKRIASHWEISEQAAHARLHSFLKHSLLGYKIRRNHPGASATSQLSPYLRHGQISPQQIFHALAPYLALDDYREDAQHFLSELVWREFSYYLLFHFPPLPHDNFQAAFDGFPWEDNPQTLTLWKKGLTGYPIVDAGMRELWETGYMHNRVRMVVGSFLIKNLNISWQHGASWFLECLCDADLASNSASWQWVAGSGADAAPYFRIFNPILQGEKFDSTGTYTRRYLPELTHIPDKYLFKPWLAPAAILEHAGVSLGHNYPHPMVDIHVSRNKALHAYHALRKK